MNSYGFDYSYALRIGEINAILAGNLANTSMPLTYSGSDPQTGLAVTVNGQLAPWSVVTGGSVQLLHLMLPFKSGTVQVDSLGSADLTGVQVTIEVRLGWLGPGSAATSPGTSTNTQLSFALSATDDPSDPGYVSIVSVANTGSMPSALLSVLENTIKEALVANPSNLQYILVSANPTPANVSSWLSPVTWDYYYTDIDNGQDGLLCFLCMLSNAPLPAISGASFDTSVVTEGANAYVVIASSAFFQNVVVPALTNAFSGSSFAAVSNGSEYQAQNIGKFNIGKVSVSSLVVTESSGSVGLQMQASGGGPLMFLFGLAKLPNASYSWSSTTNNPLSFDAASQTVSFSQDPNPTNNASHNVPWYDWVLLAAAGIGDVAGLVSAIMTLVQDTSSNINQTAASVGQGVQTALGGTTTNLGNLVDWNQGEATFTAGSCGLAGAFYFTGNLS